MIFSGDLLRAVRAGAFITLGCVLASAGAAYLWVTLTPTVQAGDVVFLAVLLPLLIAPACSAITLRAHMRSKRLSRENYRLAYMDDLTGLPNRRAFFEAASQLRTRAAFAGQQFYCAIADIDNFKRVNDTYGHEIGDQVLCDIASTLNAKAPQDCVAARLGGEEFALAGIFASPDEAATAFQRVVARVAALPIRTDRGDLCITLSLGYCEGVRTSDISFILSGADNALYAAKRAGKNRAVGLDRPRLVSEVAA
jgi:diguanylate cyclase (GGDEF)-like protein